MSLQSVMQLPSISQALTGSQVRLPADLRAQPRTEAATPATVQLPDDIRAVPAAAGNGSSDPMSQLIALLQSGVSITTIANQIASQLASLAAPSSGGTASQNALMQIIAKAISPPGNGPPGTPAQRAATLANGVQQWLMGIAGAGSQGSGQQSEFSEQFLDALTAKETPAQQTQAQMPALGAVLRLTQSLLGSAAAALQPGLVQASQPQQSPSTSSGTVSGATASSAPPAQADPSASAAFSQTFADNGNAAPQAATSNAVVNAPDLLSRMVARAASVDAQLGGTPQPAPLSTNATPTLSMTAARLASSILNTAVTAPGAGSAGGNSSSPFAGFGNGERPSQSLFATTLEAGAGSTLPVTVQGTQLVPDAAQPVQAPVDVDAVVEQMLKGISLRSIQSGTSEIRLQLAPENLGSVSMKLTVQGASISANVVAQNGHVRDMLLNNQQHLASALAESGLTLSGFSVDVSGGDAGQQQQGRAGGFGRRYVVHEFAANGDDDDTTTSSRFGPPIVPATSLGLLNSLA